MDNVTKLLENKVVIGILIAVFGFIAYLVFGADVGSDLINQVTGGGATK